MSRNKDEIDDKMQIIKKSFEKNGNKKGPGICFSQMPGL